jgi:predicted nucleic acid-binding protein
MRRLLDTNVWIDAYAGKLDACRVFARARDSKNAWIGFSSMTKLEVLGYPGLNPTDEKTIRELLAEFEEVPILPAILDVAISLRRLQKMKSPDAIIAATALFQQAELVTRNTSDFKNIAGLSVLDPSKV